MPATSAKYQAVQLTDMWFASLEQANQVSSLTTKQSLQAPDGSYYYVVSQHDPGYANWLDSGALARGTLLLRWDGGSWSQPTSGLTGYVSALSMQADGTVAVDGRQIYEAEDLRVGLFTSTDDF